MSHRDYYLYWAMQLRNKETDPFIKALVEKLVAVKEPRPELNNLQKAALKKGTQLRILRGCGGQLAKLMQQLELNTAAKMIQYYMEDAEAAINTDYTLAKIKSQESKNHPQKSKAVASHSSPAVDDLP